MPSFLISLFTLYPMSIQLQYHVPLTMQYFLVSVLFLTSIARSAPLNATKSCKEYSLPLNVTSLNLKWAFGPFESNEDMANFRFREDDAMPVQLSIRSLAPLFLKQLDIRYQGHSVSQLVGGMETSC
jgi:hypothetical protein